MSDRSEADLERCRAACDKLIEHYDTVQIFCTRHESGEEDGTVTVQFGRGNWFARFGHVKAWLVREIADLQDKQAQD